MDCVSCLLDDAGPLKNYWEIAVCVAVNLKNSTTTRSVVGKTPQDTWHGRTQILHRLSAYRCKSVDHVPTDRTKKADYTATPGTFVPYSVSSKLYFVYDTLAKTLHHSQHIVFRDGKWYTAPNAAAEAILNEDFYRDVFGEPKLKPIEKESTENHMQEPLHNDSPPDPLKLKQESPDFAGLEQPFEVAWKLLAAGSR